jgi:hypothetical protein
VGDEADSWGLVVRGMRERRPAQEGMNQKGKCTFTNAREPAGPKAGWAARLAGPKIRKKNF